MKPFLICHISLVGHGHLKAAYSLKKVFIKNAEVLDSLEFFNKGFFQSCKIFRRACLEKFPGITDLYFQNPLIVKGVALFGDMFCIAIAKRYAKYIKKNNIETVICTHSMSLRIMAYAKKYTSFNLVGVLTDYTVDSYWIIDKVDLYFVANKESKLQLTIAGIEANKITVSGIPIHCTDTMKYHKYDLYEKNGLINGKPVVLILGGGAGYGNMRSMIQALDQCTSDFQILVVTGNNKELYDTLIKIKTRKPMSLLHYVANMNEVYRISDLVITKPGGLTIAECLAIGLPMIVLKAIAGGENSNINFLKDAGVAIVVRNEQEAAVKVDELMLDCTLRNNLSVKARSVGYPDAAKKIRAEILRRFHPCIRTREITYNR